MKVLLIDTNYIECSSPEMVQRIGRQAHEYWKQILNTLGLDTGFVTEMFSYGRQWSVSAGLLSIHSYLKEHTGEPPVYLHMDYLIDNGERHRFIHEVKDAEVIGFSCTTPNYSQAKELAAEAREANPDATLVIGGPHAAFFDEDALGTFDLVVRGEGEKAFLKIAQGVDPSDIGGLSFKKDGEIIRTGDCDVLDEAEFMVPSFDALPGDPSRFILSVSTTRGCPFNCAFCSETVFWGPRIRKKSMRIVADEIKALKRLNKGIIHLSDSNLILSDKDASDLLDEIEKMGEKTYFSFNARADILLKLADSTLQRLKDNDFIEVMIGCESGSDELLRKMNKNQAIDDIERCLGRIRRFFPIIKTYWLLGFPGEDSMTLERTYSKVRDFLKQGLMDYAIAKMFIPYPGTPVYNDPGRFGISIQEGDWESYERFGFPPPYTLPGLNEFDLLAYLIRIEAMQMYHFADRLGISKEEAKKRLFDEVNRCQKDT